MKKFKAQLDRLNSSVYGHCVFVPEKISSFFLKEGSQRVICTVNGEYTFHCALMPNGDEPRFINMTKAIRSKFKLEIGDEVSIELEKDESKYGFHLPEEMEELLYQDPEGSKLFHELTPGKQRSLLHIVGKPKSSNLRLKKAVAVLTYLKESNGKLDFKELNAFMKDFQRL